MAPEIETPPPPGPWQRPQLLQRLCTASFIDQGAFGVFYFFALLGSFFVRTLSPEQFQAELHGFYLAGMSAEQAEQMTRMAGIIREHGVALCAVLLFRTVVRFIGTWRMWKGHRDGFHIYTTAQLLGVLLPMLVAGRELFSLLGLLMVLNWCFLYWTQRASMR